MKAQAPIRQSCTLPARRLHGQASTEFLAFMAISIAMLGISLAVYSQYSEAATRTQRALESQGICLGVSSAIGSFAALGEGAEANFTLPKTYAGGNYTVRVAGDRSIVKVDYSLSGQRLGVGCHYPAANVTDESGAPVFSVGKSFSMKHYGNVIVVGQ